MEDVVLHFPSGAAELGSLLETTQKLLAPFPRRPAALFSPWFPSDAAAAQRPPPIRPARRAPVITTSTPPPLPLLVSNSSSHAHTATREDKRQKHEASIPPQGSYTRALPPETVQTGGDVLCLSETPLHLLPASQRQLSPDEPQTGGAAAAAAAGFSGADSPIKRTWSVFSSQSGGGGGGGGRSLSGAFGRVVALHKLHLRQRAKWVIGRSNCGPDRDLEQVWRSLSRSVRSSRLPTCNANIQRERAEIWVFCDVLHSEQVGRLLKEQLQLSGRISLSVRRLGNVFTA